MDINSQSNFNKVRDALQQLGRFSEKESHIFFAHIKAVTVPKNYYLVKEGNVCQSFYLVVQGSFRHYQITDTGNEITQNLYLDNDWIVDYKSFTSQQPSSSVIQATEDSEVFELSVYDLHYLMKTSDAFFQLGRIFQFALQQGLHLQISTPKERYIFLLQNKPRLIQRFQLKYIASYLGMTPETLSRVRRNIAL
jgi:CRP-like cAMP-binding protein